MRVPARAVPGGVVGWTRGTWFLRVLLVVLPVAALLVALPQQPHPWLVALVVVLSVRWMWLPDDLVGVLVIALVAGWWAVDGTTELRLGAVGVLLLGAHVSATLASYGPGTMGLTPALVRLWLRRALLSLVPLVVALAAVQGLGGHPAPTWLWSGAIATTAALLLLASRATHRVHA